MAGDIAVRIGGKSPGVEITYRILDEAGTTYGEAVEVARKAVAAWEKIIKDLRGKIAA